MKQGISPIHNRFKSQLNLIAVRLLWMNVNFQVHHAGNQSVVFSIAGIGDIICNREPWFVFSVENAVIAEDANPGKLMEDVAAFMAEEAPREPVYVER